MSLLAAENLPAIGRCGVDVSCRGKKYTCGARNLACRHAYCCGIVLPPSVPGVIAWWNMQLNRLIRIYIALCSLTYLLCLASCSRPSEPQVVFAVGGAPGELAFWEQVVTDFETATGVRTRLLRRPADTDQQRQGLIIALKAGMADPDVFLMDVAWLGLFAASKWLTPLEHIDRSAFFAHLLHLVDVHNGQLLALPVYLDAGLLYYRRDLLEKFAIPQPPETWQELLEQAQTVQRQMRQTTPNFYGFVWQGRQYEGLITNFQEFAGTQGGFVVEQAGHTRIALDLPQNRTALRFMHDLIWQYQISPPFTYTEMQEEETRLLFQQGNALFERNWPYAWTLHQQPDSPVRGKIDVTLPPAPVAGQRVSSLGGWHIGVSQFLRCEAAGHAVRAVCLFLCGAEAHGAAAGLESGPSRPLHRPRSLAARTAFTGAAAGSAGGTTQTGAAVLSATLRHCPAAPQWRPGWQV